MVSSINSSTSTDYLYGGTSTTSPSSKNTTKLSPVLQKALEESESNSSTIQLEVITEVPNLAAEVPNLAASYEWAAKFFGYAERNATLTSTSQSELKNITSTINSNSDVSIDKSTVASIIKNADLEDLGTYVNSTSSDLATNLSSLTKLLNETAAKKGLNSELSTKLNSLAQSITDSTSTILTNCNSSKYNASLIANYTN